MDQPLRLDECLIALKVARILDDRLRDNAQALMKAGKIADIGDGQMLESIDFHQTLIPTLAGHGNIHGVSFMSSLLVNCLSAIGENQIGEALKHELHDGGSITR